MLSAIAWLPQGAAAKAPKYSEPTEEEIAAMKEEAARKAAEPR